MKSHIDYFLDPVFEACIERKLMKDGSLEIHCKRGLWTVNGPAADAESEAKRYWMQYFGDGEYDSMLNPTKPPLKLI